MDPSLITTAGFGAAAATVHSLSPWALFLQADWIVKAVLVVLMLASIWSWAIIFDKVRRLRRLGALGDEFEDSFWSGGSLDELYVEVGDQAPDPMTALFVSGMREWRRSGGRKTGQPPENRAGLQQRIERVMHITLGREMLHLERYMTFLASVGSVAPFIGLFGTVWGIMNSFVSIAATQNAPLATVAPGIAEALFAPALGLVAAIPAVVAYNKISTDLGRYAGRLETFASEFTAILSRQLDEEVWRAGAAD